MRRRGTLLICRTALTLFCSNTRAAEVALYES